MSDTNPILDPLNGATPRFTEEQLQDIVQWFDDNAEPLLVVNDGPPINVITIPLFSQFLSLKKFHTRHFRYPTKSEVIEEMGKLHTKKLMNKEIFLYMLDKYVKVADIKHELNLAFEVFDMEKKTYLDIDELKTMVTTYDEQLDPSELEEFLRDANVKGTGTVDYKEFIDRMFATCPELIDMEPEFLYENPNDDPSVEPPSVSPEQEESDFMMKLINEEGITGDQTAAVEKTDENETAIAEENLEINQLNEDPLLEDQNVEAKSEASVPAAAIIPEVSNTTVKFLDEKLVVADNSTVAKSEYSDVTTEKPPESVKNDDQGYEADVDDITFANK